MWSIHSNNVASIQIESDKNNRQLAFCVSLVKDGDNHILGLLSPQPSTLPLTLLGQLQFGVTSSNINPELHDMDVCDG
jgi:hypothetical protein